MGDTDHIGFLKGIGAQQARYNLSRDHHQWGAVHHGVGDSGYGVGGSGAGGDQGNTGFPGYACVALCCVDGPLFVTDQDMFYVVLMIVQRVENGHDGAAGIAEHGIYAFGQ
ncbi:hypothetical protein SDC9_160681 [bioreactor metagenome]|uniref:Uncharacterized protein n=1 Tax=bioreactor metagenome TaxID=1076179 RepID=A0A645FHC0_9ZZZZ